ncbi:hypothetical protein [Actinomycetospora soli]|uniref:hypothetical protein n=1 Tax=Actinomycetospora soli TaxID=2893887 RepID=UPI001E6190DF|nr:hypothetical protein [Actinomycetospora soli]MCD2188262.1 hypothetical protein [Actinomycetospora soli]
MNTRSRSEAIEEVALLVFLLACFLLSFFKDLFPVLEEGLAAAVFAGLLFLLKQIRDLRLELREKEVEEKYFANADEFYSSAARAVGRANREICATYFRDEPPSGRGDKRDAYFAAVIEAARQRRTVRRIIKVTNPDLAQWCVDQKKLCEEVESYYVRVLTISGDVEPMNMAILDEEVVYLAFAGPTGSQIGGVRPQGRRLASFFRSRFDEHWRIAVPIEHFVTGRECEMLLRATGGATASADEGAGARGAVGGSPAG